MSNIKMISKDGSYLHTSFISKGIKWKLISSESSEGVWNTVDEFKSENGNYQTATRMQIKNLCENKTIQAV